MSDDSSNELPPICNYEDSNYQSEFWDKGTRQYEDQVEEIALKRLLPSSGNLLLEIGAGAGRNTPRYKNYEHIVLLDYSLSQLRLAQEHLGENASCTYVAGNVYRLPFAPAIFDTTTMIRTLHHMADAPLALQQVMDVQKPGSIFILEYANKKNLKSIFRYLLRRQDWSPFSKEPVEFVELNFDFHPQAIRDWLTRCGFEIQRQLTVSHFRIRVLKQIIPTNMLVSLDSAAQLTGNLWQLSPSVFVRSKVEGNLSSSTSSKLIFKCPDCGNYPLGEHDEYLFCESCSKKWPIVDGIYDFRDTA